MLWAEALGIAKDKSGDRAQATENTVGQKELDLDRKGRGHRSRVQSTRLYVTALWVERLGFFIAYLVESLGNGF